MKNSRLSRLTNPKKNVFVHFSFLFILLIWFFCITLMPVNYQNSGDLTVIYSKNTNLYLSPLGIITVILFILFLIHSIFMIMILIIKKQSFYFFTNLNKKTYNLVFLVGWFLLFVILIMMFGFIFSAPNTSGFTEKLAFQEFVTSLDKTNITKEQQNTFISYVNRFGWDQQLKAIGLENYKDFGLNETLNSSIISFLNHVNVNFAPSNFTALFMVDSNGIGPNGVYTFNIVIFSLTFIYFSLAFFSLYLINKRSARLDRRTFKERKEMFKLLANEFKQKIKTKKENKEKRKLLLKEEEQLLVGLDNFESNEEIERISQEELQEKINKNNELKNRIIEIQSEQRKLKDDSKLFKSKNKKEEINKRSTKIKKHEITIPDEELEEIFKNLDI